MFLACLALNDLRLAFIRADSPGLGFPAVLAPFSPNRINFPFGGLPFCLAKTA